MAFSPDGRRIVTGSSDKTAKVWNIDSDQPEHTLAGHKDWVWRAAFSPDGTRILTGSLDFTARLWDAATGRELLTLKGHHDGLRGIAFSPDGGHIVTASTDGSARLWDALEPGQFGAWQSQEAAEQRLAALQNEHAADEEHPRKARAQEEGAIKRWLILAPIPLPEDQNAIEALDTEQILGEGLLRPTSGEMRAVGTRPLTWQEATLVDDYIIDFHKVLGQKVVRAVAYAVCYIRSDAQQRGLRLLAGSDDESKVYLNGEQVHRHPKNGACVPDQDPVPGIVLKAGLNVLVFKVVNELVDWKGAIRITDGEGNPVKGINVSVVP